jgi:hypothetical protein
LQHRQSLTVQYNRSCCCNFLLHRPCSRYANHRASRGSKSVYMLSPDGMCRSPKVNFGGGKKNTANICSVSLTSVSRTKLIEQTYSRWEKGTQAQPSISVSVPNRLRRGTRVFYRSFEQIRSAKGFVAKKKCTASKCTTHIISR